MWRKTGAQWHLKTLNFLAQLQPKSHPLTAQSVLSLSLLSLTAQQSRSCSPGHNYTEFARALLSILSMMPMVSSKRACASRPMLCTLLPCSPSAGLCPILPCSSAYSSFTCAKAWGKANEHCRQDPAGCREGIFPVLNPV